MCLTVGRLSVTSGGSGGAAVMPMNAYMYGMVHQSDPTVEVSNHT